MNTREQFLDEFGEAFVRNTYDRTCWALEGTFSGRIKGPEPQRRAKLYQSLDREAQDAIREFAQEAVIQALADVALFIEEEGVGLIFTDSHGQSADVRVECDGLVGDLVAHNGWIARFSKYQGGLTDTPEEPPPQSDAEDDSGEDITLEEAQQQINDYLDELFGEDADKEL